MMKGEWMWEHIVEGEIEEDWVWDVLANETFLAVTDGSYDREKAPTVSGLGWKLFAWAAIALSRVPSSRYLTAQGPTEVNFWV